MAIIFWCDLAGEWCGYSKPYLIAECIEFVQWANEMLPELIHWYEVFPMVGC